MPVTLPESAAKKKYLGPSREAQRKSASFTRRKRRKSLREIAGY